MTVTAEYDPLLTSVVGPYTAGFYDYGRAALRFESDLPYEILSEKSGPGPIPSLRIDMSMLRKPCARP